MRIGILTIHDSPNYGACLQCYALWKYLADQGYDCEVIDLHRPGAHEDYVPSKRFIKLRPSHPSFKFRIRRFVNKLLCKSTTTKRKKVYSEQAKPKFDSFNSSVKFSSAYASIDEFYKNPPDYDVYIAGSDQLWNPTQPYCIEPYFLTFVRDNKKKKISYSTSIGITKLTEKEKRLFKTWLQDFSSISVRESQAKTLLESFCDNKIAQTIDPTFLLDVDEWKQLAVPNSLSKPYILYFALHIDYDMLHYCMKLSNESKRPLYVLNQVQEDNKSNDYIQIIDAGPKEFLGYIQNAEMVITDSFHGTVFSIILGSNNFYSYIANPERGGRIVELLEMFDLSSHLLTSFDRSYSDLKGEHIDRNKVMSIMNKKRTLSSEFLKSSITS